MNSKVKAGHPPQNKFVLKLYVCGMSPKSMEAVDNITRFCTRYMESNYDLEIIDIYKNPELAAKNQIIFSPSLIKLYPEPQKLLIGNFSDTEKISRGLGIAINK